jgi:predicted nucleic acid-binding protein
MARLIDTGVFIEWERQARPFTDFPGAVGEPFAMASISASELLAGVLRAVPGARRAQREGFVEVVLARVPALPFDLAVARVHARLAADLTATGRSVGGHDLLIAATAVAHGYDLLTPNLRHFERVPGLTARLPTW